MKISSEIVFVSIFVGRDVYQTYARITGNQGLAQIFWGPFRPKTQENKQTTPREDPCFAGISSLLEMPTNSCHFPCTSDTLVRPQYSLTRKALSATRGLAGGGLGTRQGHFLDPQKVTFGYFWGQKVTFGVTFEPLRGKPRKSLFSHFGVTSNFLGLRGCFGAPAELLKDLHRVLKNPPPPLLKKPPPPILKKHLPFPLLNKPF